MTTADKETGAIPAQRLILTRWKTRILSVLFSGADAVEIFLSEGDSLPGRIYVGQVRDLVKNLQAAFVDFGQGRRGYLSLVENRTLLFAGPHEGGVKPGDRLIVQVEKEAAGTKDPVLTCRLNLAGRYAALVAGKKGIGFSARISDASFKEALRPKLQELLTAAGEEAGLIVRTNAYGQEAALLAEAAAHLALLRKIREEAPYRTAGQLLYTPEPVWLRRILDRPDGSPAEIVTDEADAFAMLQERFAGKQDGAGPVIRFYEDPLVDLFHLYSLKAVLEKAAAKRVWLKSGAYLVIEPTEALTVIDVNTGKSTAGRDRQAAFRAVNLEAAEEIARQLRLRSLSGIILIDFIDMEAQSDREALMTMLKKRVRLDPVRTTVVDMTKLGLVEITRKKERRPLSEQLAEL